MRKTLLVMVFIAALGISACTQPTTQTYTINGQTVSRVRTDTQWGENLHGDATYIVSESSMKQYIDDNEDVFNFTQGNPSFEALTHSYDEDFFADSLIVLITYEENSGSITHEIEQMTVENGTLHIDVKRIIPEAGTDDMAAWHLVVELSKDDYLFDEVNVNTITHD